MRAARAEIADGRWLLVVAGGDEDVVLRGPGQAAARREGDEAWIALEDLEPGRWTSDLAIRARGLGPARVAMIGGRPLRFEPRRRGGSLVLEVEEVGPYLEATDVSVEEGELVVDGRRLPLVPGPVEIDGLPVRSHADGVVGKDAILTLPAHGGLRPHYDGEDRLHVVAVRDEPEDSSPEVGAVSRRRRLLGGPAVWAHRAALGLAAALLRPRRAARGEPGVRFLVAHAWGLGGTVRTTLMAAEQTGADVVSALRLRRRPKVAFPEGVGVRALDDRRRGGLLGRLPSLLVHPEDYAHPWCRLSTDVALVRFLRAQPPGTLVATRPALNLLAARLSPPGVRVVGQEHMHFGSHRPGLARDLLRHYPRLAALTVLTEADRADYAPFAPRVERIPNAVAPLGGGRADPGSPLVVAAGRLTGQKGFDLLIRAFAPLAAEFPAWRLRIYGSGPQRAALGRLIAEHELHGRVLLMGPTRHMGEALAEGSVFALSSRFEGFGMVLVEAMSKGLAVVSFDCPRGPAEIVSHGRDGLLVGAEDVTGMTAALRELLGSEARRAELGEAAARTAEAYAPEAVGERWRGFLQELAA